MSCSWMCCAVCSARSERPMTAKPAALPARVDRGVQGLVDRRAQLGAQDVAGLVVGDGLALTGGEHRGRLARPGDDAQEALEQVLVRDHGALLAGGHDRALVEHLGQLGAGRARGDLGEVREVDVLGERLALACTPRMARRPSSDGDADVDVTREAARAQQRRVQRVQAVGRGDHEHPLVAAEAVHLDEQLVEGLVGLAVALAAVRAAAALGADGVDLVDEDDRGRAPRGPWRTGRGRGSAPTPTYISTKSEPDIA